MSIERHDVEYGERRIEFRLERRPRETLSISVSPDLAVDVIAPERVSLEEIYEKVRKRAHWITRQVRYFEQFHPRTPARRYINGETHMYLGRQYRLQVFPHTNKAVKLYRGRLVVQTLKPEDTELTQNLIADWYRHRALAKFPERLALCGVRFPDVNNRKPSGVLIRRLERRWGSMTPTGKLVLSPDLIRASVDAIDYVITHELCHLKHQHHGHAFYSLLTKVMPDWQSRKIKLERQLA